jgi:2-polyprenyl-3-methyl-5-hydroxy-6-metoxy-1,4-benzoquinol methylase
MAAIEIVVVYNDPITLEHCFLKSAGLESARLVLVDNRVAGKGLPTIFNSHKSDSVADWLIFCHQDFIVFESQWLDRVANLSPTACYGPIGMDVQGRMLGQITQTNGTLLGQRVDMAEVMGLDEQCLIVPRCIYSVVDFDERLPFDLYVHDYCLEVRRQLGYPTRTMQLNCQHKSRTLIGDLSSERYLTAKDLFIRKHSYLPVIATTSFYFRQKYWEYVDGCFTLSAELELIPRDSKVLEIGPGPGHMTQAMRNRGCDVTGIEINEELARCSQQFCSKLIIGDIETLDLDRELNGGQFDVVLLGDVLEHLKNPENLLTKLKKYLTPSGSLVVSLPNVAHGSVRLALLQGDFKYQSEGLLDSTHLKFFTWETIRAVFRRTGYDIQKVKRIQVGIFHSGIKFDPLKVPVGAFRNLCRQPEAFTYQYVFNALPSNGASKDGKEEDLESAADLNRFAKDEKFKLAVAYKDHGTEYFWNNPPKFRQFFYRSFLLSPHLLTVMYIMASFLPFRLLKAIDSSLDISSRKKMVPEANHIESIAQTAWVNYL